MSVEPREAGLRTEVLAALRSTLSDTDVAGVEKCATRLQEALPRDQVADNVVMVAYGGGKDSSYTLAFVRAVQLCLYARLGTTFKLRSATNRHAGMPQAVMDNIDRAYTALGMTGDPDCEMLLVDGPVVKPFAGDEPLPAAIVDRNRLDLLMTGHRTFGEARPTFCNACNLSMVNSFGAAAAHGTGVDVIITGDSPEEQRAYSWWIRRLSRKVNPHQRRRTGPGFRGFLQDTDMIASAYFAEVYGPDASAEIRERAVTSEVSEDIRFFSIFDDTRYSSGEHWALLTELLEFEFDEIAFSFTESDCGNPTIMAHLRALKAERVHGRAYAEGLAEYVDFAESLMRVKEFPENLIEVMRQRYRGPDAATRMRAVAGGFAEEAYGLTEEQLVCMLHSPFTDKGERLERYLEAEQPQLAGQVDTVRSLLDGEGEPMDPAEAELVPRLTELTGLELSRLRTLYHAEAVQFSAKGGPSMMAAILEGDPHKAEVRTRLSPDGPEVIQLATGR
ncbi:PqqD family protein [Streptomyces sp. M41]|uniref:PqqD family protein n=1 Tax=Streptomyces sp. M41 TaxID=3059412 RepID=UPI00374DA4DB